MQYHIYKHLALRYSAYKCDIALALNKIYINLVCQNDAIIIQYIISYSTIEQSDIQNIGLVVGVLGCDTAITFLDTHHRSYILHIGPISRVYMQNNKS